MDSQQLDKSMRRKENETTEYRKSKQRKKKKTPITCWQSIGDGDGPVNTDRMKVSQLVQDILEEYINYGKRQERFDPGGVFRTTPRMYNYDITYKVLDHLDVGARCHSSCVHQTNGKVHHTSVSPAYQKHSRQMTPKKEADRLVRYAGELLDKFPIEKLNVIHRYRPNSAGVRRSVGNGDIANYSCHFGAALNTDSYIQYYIKQGLNSGNTRHCNRLRKLQKVDTAKEKKKHEDFRPELQLLENVDTVIGGMPSDDHHKAAPVTVFAEVAVQTDAEGGKKSAKDERKVSSNVVLGDNCKTPQKQLTDVDT